MSTGKDPSKLRLSDHNPEKVQYITNRLRGECIFNWMTGDAATEIHCANSKVCTSSRVTLAAPNSHVQTQLFAVWKSAHVPHNTIVNHTALNLPGLHTTLGWPETSTEITFVQ